MAVVGSAVTAPPPLQCWFCYLSQAPMRHHTGTVLAAERGSLRDEQSTCSSA
eukprot:CAMPEP_0175751606 /NCGR_PEP_ID=MMETSP0097-20121207/61312_1 /TAXON_ID=311494 /ORGANISM="Alexandrium monilatum, Strain CCMP3105" /LENGTH=51 /DNA_ID=CAMNT_0017060317 /DNA_START=14 /DNA_END=169 /DNA_ORIENTATION=-